MVADLTADQRSLRELTRDVLSARASESVVRDAMASPSGLDETLWQQMAQLGLCGLAVPTGYGGAGCGPAEIALVMRELGRTLAPVPYFSTVALAQSVVLQSRDDSAWERLLPDLAAGRRGAAVALVEPSWTWDPHSVQTTASEEHSAKWRLTGTKTFVVDGATADVILLAAETPSGVGLFEVDAGAPGVTRTALRGIDQTRRLATIDLADAPAHRIGGHDAGRDILGRALLLANVYLAAESVGATESVLSHAVAYAKTRKQFGRYIGAFQAIKHKCADMHVDFETARCTLEHAVSVVAPDTGEDAVIAAATCAALCHETFLRCAAENIQIHGGIGFTWEHHAHLYYKRAQGNRVLLGDDVHHRRILAESLGLLL
ncbi:acyl-CoA dehydrogenase family protein [Mycolicibacterium stellerae]|uniref:acyl-CoA dehydrogenase family protein n=1 Tax=Mycolicibacterium stellerae TaxID=2358193 RepID=UPI000F0B4B58|nr:acyl-CoA dehydrogenase family protein [Mycolicibacterium stellerae]